MKRRQIIMTLTLAMAWPAITSAAPSSNNPTTTKTKPEPHATHQSHATRQKGSGRRIHSRKELGGGVDPAAKAAEGITFAPSAKAPNMGKPLNFQQLHDITYNDASRANLTPAQSQQATTFLYQAGQAQFAASQGGE